MPKYILLRDIQEVSQLCFVLPLKSVQQTSLISYYILPLSYLKTIFSKMRCEAVICILYFDRYYYTIFPKIVTIYNLSYKI